MSLELCVAWLILSVLNLITGIVQNDFQRVFIALLEGLLAWDRYDDYKRGA